MLLPNHKSHNSLGLILIATIIAIAGVLASIYVYQEVDRVGRGHILDRANTIARAISVEDFKTLTGTETDLELPTYEELKALMIAEREVNRDVRFIYLLGKHDTGTLFFYIDSEDPGSPDYSPPGQEYPEATSAMHTFFDDGVSISEGPDRDRWGIWISGYAPLHDADGTVLALVGIDLPATRFVTDLLIYSSIPVLVALILVLLVLVAAAAHRREQERIEQKEEFLSIASHEIRTPMTGIKWGIESLLRDGALPEQTRKLLMLMHDNAQNLVARLNNLLDMTALETKGKGMLKYEYVSVRELLGGITKSLELAARERSVTLTIPETDASFTADKQMMHHVFFNLLGNAVKYTKEGTDVRVTCERTTNGYVFRVQDQGEGIAPEDQKRIFDGYHRTDEATHSSTTGTGLGLYLTKRAIELHGGTITVESAPGTGTTFVVTLPAKEA